MNIRAAAALLCSSLHTPTPSPYPTPLRAPVGGEGAREPLGASGTPAPEALASGASYSALRSISHADGERGAIVRLVAPNFGLLVFFSSLLGALSWSFVRRQFGQSGDSDSVKGTTRFTHWAGEALCEQQRGDSELS